MYTALILYTVLCALYIYMAKVLPGVVNRPKFTGLCGQLQDSQVIVLTNLAFGLWTDFKTQSSALFKCLSDRRSITPYSELLRAKFRICFIFLYGFEKGTQSHKGVSGSALQSNASVSTVRQERSHEVG